MTVATIHEMSNKEWMGWYVYFKKQRQAEEMGELRAKAGMR